MSHHNLHRQEAVVEYPEYHDESPVDQIESPPASPPRSPPRSTLNIHAPRDRRTILMHEDPLFLERDERMRQEAQERYQTEERQRQEAEQRRNSEEGGHRMRTAASTPNFRHDRHEAPLPPLPVSHHLYEGRPHSPHRLSTNRQTTNLGLSIPSSFTQHHHVQQVGEVSPLSQHSDDHALHNSNEQAWHQIEWEHQTGHDVDHEYAQIVSSHLSQERRAAIGRMVGAELEHRRRMAEMRPGSAGGVHRPRRRDAIWDRFRGRSVLRPQQGHGDQHSSSSQHHTQHPQPHMQHQNTAHHSEPASMPSGSRRNFWRRR